jgi:hypothetical protein
LLLEETDDDEAREEEFDKLTFKFAGNELTEEVGALTGVEVTPAGPIARNAVATTPTTITVVIAAVAKWEMAARLFVLIRSIDT